MKVRVLGTQHTSLVLVVGIFVLAVVFVNPLRETAAKDDWAYAWTVRHLLETGQYQLHDWAAPNLLFQAYWGAFFARILGNSFSA